MILNLIVPAVSMPVPKQNAKVCKKFKCVNIMVVFYNYLGLQVVKSRSSQLPDTVP
jgi:hypothetical protein